MLFDLRGKRRRVVKATYLTLAILMGSSLVLFGLGSDAGGGLLDAVGIGGHGGSSGHGGGGGSVNFEDRAEELEEDLADDPRNERVLLRLAEARYQAGTSAAEGDGGGHGGDVTLTEESVEQFRESVAAWERYIDLKPKRPNSDTAAIVVQAYAGLSDLAGAAQVQEIVAEDAPSQGAFANLALYRFASGDLRAGDRAANRAVAEAPESQRQTVRTQLEQIRRQARTAASQGGAAESQPTQP